ncbi:MAG: hypothetical protein LBG70_01775, partial [Bifidobacteriaceae bacterium]|nr:hypothetical protein [Bifidobacteriaceae bacterium]
MKPMDGRLLRHAHSARNYVFITAGLGIAKAGLVVVQAWLLANLIGLAITEAASIEQASARLISLVVVTVGRAGLAGTQQRLAHRAATKTIA